MAIRVLPSVEVRKKLTPDDAEQMYDRGEFEDHFYELVDGELVELPRPKPRHGHLTVNVIVPLATFASRAGGQVYSNDTGFRVSRDRRDVRGPDVAYLGPARLPIDEDHWTEGAPDLAVEVLSDEQYGQAYARTKVREYIDAGAQLVWLVDGRRREVRVYRPDADEYTIYRNDAVLTLDPIIDGFELKVSDIFR
jgi:Uma2 family endonuclease